MQILWIVFFSFAFSWSHAASELGCAAALAVESARAEILAHSERDRVLRKNSSISSLSREETEVGARLTSRATAGDHVVSLGSGPDIFRPFYVFPNAGHFHLVDLGRGWCDGFKSIFDELEARLSHLGPSAHVRVVRTGFVRYRPRPDFTKVLEENGETAVIGPWRYAGGRWQFYKHPHVWRVSWQPEKGPRRRIFVYLHVGDFSDLAFGRSVVRSTRDRLAGLFLTGIGAPDQSMLDEYLTALKPGGLFFAQLNYVNSADQRPGGEADGDFEALAKRLDVIWQRPPSADVIAAHPRLFWPTSYLFEKPRSRDATAN